MMSSAAIANGGGVAAGSTVAVLQSIGAVGLATPIGLGLVASGCAVGAIAGGMHAASNNQPILQRTIQGKRTRRRGCWWNGFLRRKSPKKLGSRAKETPWKRSRRVRRPRSSSSVPI
ncbi:hypothetical protein DYB36_008576 [Aphanomyces astaci]|uniref:Uncharacterized protein n=1 Tax=Aphanomyces astaci TaxID=112090 RepID=A0A397B2R1_APHAT|nr:hypothetical protein DYB36_008576 [Aphanomyces astaci]